MKTRKLKKTGLDVSASRVPASRSINWRKLTCSPLIPHRRSHLDR
jgi:hypothetical protein